MSLHVIVDLKDGRPWMVDEKAAFMKEPFSKLYDAALKLFTLSWLQERAWDIGEVDEVSHRTRCCHDAIY